LHLVVVGWVSFYPNVLMLDKLKVIRLILAELDSRLELARGASLDAAQYATDEEAKADSKYDTQGLEASYLAAGQAAQVVEAAKTVQLFRGYLEDAAHRPMAVVQAGALFRMVMPMGSQWFFLASSGGGVQVDLEGESVWVVTPQSPVGRGAAGKTAGMGFRLPNEQQVSIETVC
jgi:hypothetical protein